MAYQIHVKCPICQQTATLTRRDLRERVAWSEANQMAYESVALPYRVFAVRCEPECAVLKERALA